MSLDVEARRHIYAMTTAQGKPPSIQQLSEALGASDADTTAALARLAASRIVVLQPDSGELLMVPPFSAVPTPFLVRTPAHASYANCAWDALGIPVMLKSEASIESACGCCGEAITIDTGGDAVTPVPAVVHFAIPTARWWQDIVFT